MRDGLSLWYILSRMIYMMDRTDMSNLEGELERGVLVKYILPDGLTVWHAHDKVGPDDIVHYFSRSNQKYALVWSDHPNVTFIHEENMKPVPVKGGKNEWLHIEEGELMGYYSLYEDY